MSVESVAEELRGILEPLGLPVAQTTYTGKEPVYIVFNYATVPEMYADDGPQYERYLIQVHLFAPVAVNTRKTERGIKRALLDAGYQYPSTVDASDDTRGASGATRHRVFETETVRWCGDG